MNTKLAINGAAPRFPEPLHIGRPNLGRFEDFEVRLKDIWERKWLTNNGPYVQEFEAAISERLNVRNCVAVCNGTVGLEIAVRALELTGEVIIPAFTFIATAHAVRWQRLTPVFCDVLTETHNIDVASVKNAISSETSAILAVNLWGNPCQIAELQSIADAFQLKLIFDSSHAFNNSYQGQKLGGFGDAEVFSFHATKFVNAFEGGVITTNDDELAESMRLIRNFGFSGYDEVTHLGTNGKMCEVSAAMGLTSLESIDEFVARNRANYGCYQTHLAVIPGIRLLPCEEDSNHQYIVIEVDPQRYGIDRDRLIQVLHAENVLARRYFYNGCHRQVPYNREPISTRCSLPITDRICERVMQLPTGIAITESDIDLICEIIRIAPKEAP